MPKNPVIDNLKTPYRKWSSSWSSLRGPQFRRAQERMRQDCRILVEIHVHRSVCGPGVIGYKGTVLELGSKFRWPPPPPKVLEDWSGLYVGSREQAEGNLVSDSGDKDGYLLEISLTKPFWVYKITSKYIADATVRGEYKVSYLKMMLKICPGDLLIPALGSRNYLYWGPLSHEDFEYIIPTNLTGYTKAKPLSKCTVYGPIKPRQRIMS